MSFTPRRSPRLAQKALKAKETKETQDTKEDLNITVNDTSSQYTPPPKFMTVGQVVNFLADTIKADDTLKSSLVRVTDCGIYTDFVGISDYGDKIIITDGYGAGTYDIESNNMTLHDLYHHLLPFPPDTPIKAHVDGMFYGRHDDGISISVYHNYTIVCWA
jgi:hypothetical protein